MSTSVHSHSYSPGVGLCKTCGQNVTSQTGYKTWLCELGKKIQLGCRGLRKTSPTKPKIQVESQVH